MSQRHPLRASLRLLGLFLVMALLVAMFGVTKALEFAAAVLLMALVVLMVAAVGNPPAPPTRGAW